MAVVAWERAESERWSWITSPESPNFFAWDAERTCAVTDFTLVEVPECEPTSAGASSIPVAPTACHAPRRSPNRFPANFIAVRCPSGFVPTMYVPAFGRLFRSGLTLFEEGAAEAEATLLA